MHWTGHWASIHFVNTLYVSATSWWLDGEQGACLRKRVSLCTTASFLNGRLSIMFEISMWTNRNILQLSVHLAVANILLHMRMTAEYSWVLSCQCVWTFQWMHRNNMYLSVCMAVANYCKQVCGFPKTTFLLKALVTELCRQQWRQSKSVVGAATLQCRSGLAEIRSAN